MNRIVAAAALGVAVWSLVRWLERSYAPAHREPHPAERWENEGGAVSSASWTQRSQAPQ
jgi:hypothetical protein